MVHGRMIRPPVAGATPVKVDESSIKDIPGAQVVVDKRFLGVVADKEWDAIQAAQKLKVEWSQSSRRSRTRLRSTITSASAPVRKRVVEKDERQCRRRLQDRGPRDRGRIRMAVPVACQHGPGLRASSRSRTATATLLDRHRRSRISSRRRRRDRSMLRRRMCTASRTAGSGSYGRNDAGDCRHRSRRSWPRRSAAGARCNICASRAPAGIPRDRPRSIAPALRLRRRRQGHRLRIHQQGVLAGRRRHQ